MTEDATRVLADVAARIGPGVRDLAFRLHFGDGATVTLAQCHARVATTADGTVTITALHDRIQVRWVFAPWEGGGIGSRSTSRVIPRSIVNGSTR